MTRLRALAASIADRWPWWALAGCVFMLAVAHFYFQDFRGLSPCPLCLTQREVYWAGGALSLGAIAAGRFKAPVVRLVAIWLLVPVFLTGAGFALWHAGLEARWWTQGECAGGGFFSGLIGLRPRISGLGDLAEAGRPIVAARCEDVVWRDPVLGLTMAGWNVIISLKMAGWSLVSALRRLRS